MTPLLATKLHLPLPRPQLVRRRRLTEQLNEGLQRTLTLISAPAGFGKTTLLSEWAQSTGHPVAWLSLDAGDNDPTQFLAYLVATLQQVGVTRGEGVMEMLHAPQPPPTEAVLTALLNKIMELPHQVVLVLDDYHVIDTKPVDQVLTFLLEHLPPQLHLVIATREDPQFPLARFRARGELTELRAAQLRFTPDEVTEFLRDVMGLQLSATDIAALEDRTEGWIAGLQLAALSMQGREDLSGFIRVLAGNNRYIADYLVEEVLQRQPEPVRHFLLQTAILDRLSGPLCEAVTGQLDANVRLEALERGNFFVVPLDDQRHWYRYHHLFADVLQAHLKAEQPGQVARLHRRASVWYEHNGSAADAIRHALAAQDVGRAAELIEWAVPALRRSRQEATVLGWLRGLPDQLLRARPVLSVHYAWALMLSGEFVGVEARLRDAEQWLDRAIDTTEPLDAGSAEMVVVDQEEFRQLPGSVAMYRAAVALASGDLAGTMTSARLVLDLVPEDDHLRRGAAAGLLGLASWTSGDLKAAHRSYTECVASMQRAGHLSDAVGITLALADIQIAQGRLRRAMQTYEHALQLAAEQGIPLLRGTADMYVGMGELYRERDDLQAATQHLVRSKAQGEHTGSLQNRYRWCVAMARILEAQGDLDGALKLLDEAERLYVADFFPNVRPIAALKARVHAAQGRLNDVLGWAREQGLSAHDDLSYLREFEHVTLARGLMAQYKSDRTDLLIASAMRLLERLLRAAEEGERTRSIIEILVLQAIAHQLRGNLPAAGEPLSRALTLAEPEGYLRIFIDEGPPMAVLLNKVAKHGTAPKYVRQLLTALGKSEKRRPVSQAATEALSEREREVLRLLGTDLNGPEIARELGVSLNTLRSHTKTIYSKLGVNNRRAAVRCTELPDSF